jgi:O-antigen/teichoic acid export membrane protein
MGNRTKKSILNAEVELTFYFLSLLITFFSRKIFLDNLSADFVGLIGTLLSILGFLNISELGIGLSISYFLFKPLADKDQEKITEILSLLGFLYKRIGQLILLIGGLVSLSFPLIFGNSPMPLCIVYFAFFSFLGSSAIGYFINYRRILLDADQKIYLVSIYGKSFDLLKSILQIVLAIYFKNLYLWVAIEFIASLIQCIVLNWKINKEYPWLKTDKSKGASLLKEYPEVLKKTKQIVIHQMKDFLLTKSDEIMIFAFVSLKMVAYYGNYVMIITKISTLFLTIFSGTASGIGNLVAENDKTHTMNIFWQLSSAKYLIAGIIVFLLSFLITPFIVWWLGNEYQLNWIIVTLFMVYLYIMQTRVIVDMFNHSYGLYGDVWSAWAEGIINIFVTIVIAINWGIIGILSGKIISLFFIVVLWKPYYLFSQGFKESIAIYWKGVFYYYISFFLAFAFMIFLTIGLHITPSPTIGSIILYGIKVVFPTILIYILLMLYIAPGTKQLFKRIKIAEKIFHT